MGKDDMFMGWLVIIIGILYLLPLVGVTGVWVPWVVGILVIIAGIKLLMKKGK